jgi:succinate dehydrogenase/fumarate reductase cytochrome b subunit
MSTIASSCKHHFEVQQPEKPVCACKGLLWPRRTHALCGLLAGCFLVLHLIIGATGLSPAAYQGNIDLIHSVVGRLPTMTAAGIFLLFLYQAASGIYLLRKEGIRYNVKKCNRGSKLNFFLQRLTGMVILAFLLFHVGTMHEWGLHAVYRVTHWAVLQRYAAGSLFQPQGAAFRSTAEAFGTFCGAWSLGNGLVAGFLLLGIWATAFHAGNGAWTGAVIWKLAPTPEAKRIVHFVRLAVVGVLFLAGTVAWYSFTLSHAARVFAR